MITAQASCGEGCGIWWKEHEDESGAIPIANAMKYGHTSACAPDSHEGAYAARKVFFYITLARRARQHSFLVTEALVSDSVGATPNFYVKKALGNACFAFKIGARTPSGRAVRGSPRADLAC